MFNTMTQRTRRGTKEDGEQGGNGWTFAVSAETARGSRGRASRGAPEARSDGRGLRPAGADVGVVNNHSDERREEPETRRSLETFPTR